MVDEGVDLATLRGWRATFEARVAALEGMRLRLTKLADDIGELPAIRAKMADERRKLEIGKKRLDARILEKGAREKRVNAAEAAVAREDDRRSSCRERIANIAWVRKVAPEYAELREKASKTMASLGRAREALARAEEDENRANERVAEGERRRAKALERMRSAGARLALLGRLVGELEDWTVRRDKIEEGLGEESSAAQALDWVAARRSRIAEELRESERREAELRKEAERIDSRHSEVRGLLAKLEGYIDSGVCPLCGEDHGTTEELLGEMRKQRTEDAPGEASEALRTVRKEIRELSGKDAELAATEGERRGQLAEVQRQRLRNERDNTAFLVRLESAGVARGVGVKGARQQLDSLRETQASDIEEIERELEATSKVEAAGARAARESKNRIEESREGVTKCNEVFSGVRTRLETLRRDSRVGGEDLEGNEERMKAAEAFLRRGLEQAEDSYQRARSVLAEERAILEGINADVVSIRSELSFRKDRIGDLTDTCRRIEVTVEELNISDDIGREGVLGLIGELTRRRAELEGLRDAVSRVEMALDAATTRAAFGRLRESVRKRQEAMEASAKQRDVYVGWLESFEGVAEVLTSEQRTAVRHFAKEYGPRTSVIQKRLRSVYGFGEIEILSEDSRIKVRARRGEDELRPTDYFSQSQQQTLLLGLFLTACVSQTWSALAPVFLDDPVTHFDDLNAYAFLDLVRGLLESGPGAQQFVISSCDEKFFELAREKFRYMGDAAIFYRLTGIGEEGPEVNIV